MNKNRIGLFGGTFNPVHMGHVNSMLTVAEKLDLNLIKVIPAREAPLRNKVQGPTPEQRLDMVKLGLDSYKDILQIDEMEIKKEGISYTIDTLDEFLKNENCEENEFFLIVGADQFYQFDQWKNYSEILKRVNLIVTSRPGQRLPSEVTDFPSKIQEMVEGFDGKIAILNTGREIDFIQLEDINISGTDIRKKIRMGGSVHNVLHPEVGKYIEKNKLFSNIGPKVTNYEELTKFCINILKDKNGIRIRAYDLRGLDKASEFTIVVSGNNTRHVSALADYVISGVKEEYETYPLAYEGQNEGKWVAVDYGSLIIHVFYDLIREEYKIEELYSDGKKIEVE